MLRLASTLASRPPVSVQTAPGTTVCEARTWPSSFLEFSGQNLQAALQRAARTPMGALLQLIGEPPDHQIATEAQGRSSVMQCPPGTPQLLCRPIDQIGDFAIKLAGVPGSQQTRHWREMDSNPRSPVRENGFRDCRRLAFRARGRTMSAISDVIAANILFAPFL
jgi:hypothetical protein